MKKVKIVTDSFLITRYLEKYGCFGEASSKWMRLKELTKGLLRKRFAFTKNFDFGE